MPLSGWMFAALPQGTAGTGGSPAPEWRFAVEPYLWLAGVDGSASADTSEDDDVGSSYEIDAAILLAVEARRGADGPGFLADGLGLRLVDEDGALRTRIEATIVEAGGAWPLAAGRKLDLIAGLRYVDLGLDLELGNLDVGSASAEWVDPWIGARSELQIGGAFSGVLRGDVGGFGLGSDFTWQAVAGVRAELGSHVRVDLGYRALAIDFDDDDLAYDAVAHGPFLGLAAVF